MHSKLHDSLRNMGGRSGYVLGGLGTSSLNNIRWNESSARAGAFLGAAVVTTAQLIFLGYAGGSELIEWVSIAYPEPWGYLQTGLTYLKYALMVYDVASLSMDSHVYTMLQLAFSEKISPLAVPLFGWKALAFALDRIYDEYERRL